MDQSQKQLNPGVAMQGVLVLEIVVRMGIWALALAVTVLAGAGRMRELAARLSHAGGFVPYAAYRSLDILSYELEIVFLDRHQDRDVAKAGGHLLSVDRRVMLLFIHLLDFIGCYAVLYLGIVSVQAECAFTAPSVKSSVEALYFSVVVASFTGLSAVTPASVWARLTVVSEVLLNLVLLTMLFSTVVGLGNLTEMTPRPPKASRRFRHWR